MSDTATATPDAPPADAPSIFPAPSLVDRPATEAPATGIFAAREPARIEASPDGPMFDAPAPRLVDTARSAREGVTEPPKSDAAPADWEAEFEKLVPSAPKFLKDQKEIDGWKSLKGTLKTTLAEKQALEMRLSEFEKGVQRPSGEELDRLRAEIRTEVEGKAREAQTRAEAAEARLGLLGLRQFRETYDTPRAQIVSEVQEIAKEAGLDAEKVNEYLKAPSKYAAEKILDSLTDDRTAVRILGQHRSEFQRLTAERQKELESEDPLAALQKWQAEDKAAQARLAGNIFQTMRTQFESALPDVAQAVKEFDGPLGLFFGTSAGAVALNEIAEGISKNEVWDPKTMLSWAAKSKAADALSSLAAKQQQKIQDLQGQLARLSKAQPSGPDGRPGTSAADRAPSIFGNIRPRGEFAF